MSCRCSDILSLNRQIDRLQEALSYANKANESKENTINALINASDTYDTGVVFDGAEDETVTEIKNAYNNASEAIDNAVKSISSAIVRAQSTLSSYRSEDKRHHEEKKKHKNN